MPAVPQRNKKPLSLKTARGAAAQPLESLPAALVALLADSMAQAKSESDALRDGLALAHDLSRARLAFASRFDADKGMLSVVATRGRSGARAIACSPGEGPVGKAYTTQEIIREGEQVAIPVVDRDEVRAVLAVVQPRQPVADSLWRALARHLAAGMQIAQLRDAATRRTRDLETAVAGLKSLEKARDELLGNVSHELKSPLTTIKAYLSIGLKGGLADGDKARKAYEVCNRNADRLLRLINDMLLMSRLQGGRMTLADRPFGLRALAQEAAGPLAASAAAASVSIQFGRGGEVFVKGDRDRLHEALVHLLENGIVYNRPSGQVRVEAHAEGGVAVLEVSDTGQGIPPEDLPHIFDRFYRGQAKAARSGSGLGLAIVRQIAQLHGGSVSASSAPGQGTTLTLRLPLFAGEVSAGPREAEPRDGTVLLVEDDSDCREVLGQVLEAEGLSVAQAFDAQGAMRQLQASRPALVLLDLRLGRQDGRAVLQHIRADARLASTPVFVISGAADSAAGIRYDGPERIDGFFEKPLNLQRLLDRVREVVRPGASAAEAP